MQQRRRVRFLPESAVALAVPAALLACFESRDGSAGANLRAARDNAALASSSSPAARGGPARGKRACPRFAPGRQTGKIEDKSVSEASGLVASRQNPGVLWTHNDSGGDARLFALSIEGRDLGTYSLKKAKASDWEDIALGPGPESGKWYLYVADIGANNEPRDEVVVYRVVEPEVKPDQKAKKRKLKHVDELRLYYPDGESHDAETLMIDPVTSHLYLVTKALGGNSRVFRARAPLSESEKTPLERVASVRFTPGVSDSGLATAGDIAADGSAILVRTYSRAYLWPRRPGTTIAQALRGAPCRVPLESEPQGEAIAFAATLDGYFTLSEGRRSPIYHYARLQ
jgi:hypothetical protein